MAETSEVIQVYNKLTEVKNQFHVMNYLSSLRYCHHGLLLSSALVQLANSGVNYKIISGFNHSNPLDTFQQVSIQVTDRQLGISDMVELNMDHRYNLKETEFKVSSADDTYIIVVA